MVIYFSLLVAFVGLITYALATNAKAAEVGRLMFLCGLIAFLLDLPAHSVALLGK